MATPRPAPPRGVGDAAGRGGRLPQRRAAYARRVRGESGAGVAGGAGGRTQQLPGGVVRTEINTLDGLRSFLAGGPGKVV